MKPLALFAILLVLLGAGASSSPRWALDVDSRVTDQWVATGPGRVYVERDGKLAAIDIANGAIAWQSDIPTNGPPALSRNALAVASAERILFLDPRNGVAKGSVKGTALLAGSSSNVVAAFSIPDERGYPRSSEVRGYDALGRVIWRLPLAAVVGDLVQLEGNLVMVVAGNLALFIDAANGKAVASASDVDELVGADGRYVWFTVVNGGVKGLDLDTARSFAIHDGIQRKQIRVEHNIAVAVVDGRLTLMNLKTGSVEPLHIYGRWVGGPVDNSIFIERSDGLYIQRLAAGSRAVNVAKYASETRFTTSNRKTGYVGLRDGTLLVVDVASQRLARTVDTGCDFYEGITSSGHTAIVHCDAGKGTRLLAF